MPFIFSQFIPSIRIPSTILNRSCESLNPCLVCNLTGNGFSLSWFYRMLAIGFIERLFIRKLPLIPTKQIFFCVSLFHRTWILDFVKCLSLYLLKTHTFFNSLVCWYGDYIIDEFSIGELALCSQNKSQLVLMYCLFRILWFKLVKFC